MERRILSKDFELAPLGFIEVYPLGTMFNFFLKTRLQGLYFFDGGKRKFADEVKVQINREGKIVGYWQDAFNGFTFTTRFNTKLGRAVKETAEALKALVDDMKENGVKSTFYQEWSNRFHFEGCYFRDNELKGIAR